MLDFMPYSRHNTTTFFCCLFSFLDSLAIRMLSNFNLPALFMYHNADGTPSKYPCLCELD